MVPGKTALGSLGKPNEPELRCEQSNQNALTYAGSLSVARERCLGHYLAGGDQFSRHSQLNLTVFGG